MQQTKNGILAVIAACILWGASPLLYRELAHVPPLEVLAHRTLWSLVFFGAVLAVQGRLGQIAVVFKKPALFFVVLTCSVLISLNWGLFIWGIQQDQLIEVSLGYFIYPLMTVMLGGVVFGERLGRVQMFSVAVIGFAVALLTWGLGAAPWISLVLGALFATYSIIKKTLPLGPVVSVTAEVLLLTPLALIWLGGVHLVGWQSSDGVALGAFGQGWYQNLLLMLLGPMTAGPLILFSYGAKRLSFASLGLIFYLAPSLQFMLAVLVFGEAVSLWHAISFPIIWGALAVYSVYALRLERAVRKAERKSATVSSTL